MAYREKLAGLNLAAMALVYAVYFTLVAVRPPVARLIDMLWLFGIIATAHAFLVGLGTLLIRFSAGREGAAPPDERDRAIARRGRSVAYPMLLAGIILVGIVMPFSEPPAAIVNATLLAIVIAELTHYGTVLTGYRRGWHG
ncbi:hypothetical protein [Sphingomonas hengshuiensis]|uniref:Uncharacterized protein n=1 Tax=Sphingomonas hengshuiensis TaxID=1609977 RepID=A0A7U4J9J7_9SPHN|nr:hypothetical protein [Sphingomonas hengshuiensis]AJP72760.1 hypothetical protein TS85_14725 [Sphingomonas hengshuiensis]